MHTHVELAAIGAASASLALYATLTISFALGWSKRFREHGYEVGVVHAPVENRNVRATMGRMIERHTRWAKMRRAIMPGAFFVEPLSCPIVTALASVVIAPCVATLSLVVVALIARMLFAAIALRVVRGHAVPVRYLALEPLRALAVQLCWTRAVFSRRVNWRGHPFLLEKDSVLTPISKLPLAHARGFAGSSQR